MNQYYEEIYEYAKTVPVIDSHEHLAWREEYREKKTDILNEYLYHYIDTEMMSAGMTWDERMQVIDISRPIRERWDICAPYWELARNTGHARSLDRAVQEIYGAPRIDGRTIEFLNEQFLKSLEGGQYRKVLKNLCHIEYAVLDIYDSAIDCDREFFRGVFHVDWFLNPCMCNQITLMENKLGCTVRTLDDWLAVTEKELRTAVGNGAIGFKSAIAYSRSILFGKPSRKEAEEGFRFALEHREALTKEGVNPCSAETRALEDYMVHYIARFANERGLIFQIHTGAQGPNWRKISDTDPALLLDLLAEYRDVKFDLFHSGYPYQSMTGAIGQMYPNAFIDMCWTHMMNPAAAENMLYEWLDNVPVNKIIGFGGDYALVDGVCGHLALARENISRALSRKVETGAFDMEGAKWIVKRLLHDNGRALYGE